MKKVQSWNIFDGWLQIFDNKINTEVSK